MSNLGCGGCDEITLPLGQDGSDGKNAFTITTSSFTQPAVNSNITINVSSLGQFSNAWASVGQIIFINDSSGNGGYYSVVSTTGNNSIEIRNLGYPDNAGLNIPILSGASVSPSGIRGAAGTAGRGGSPGTPGSQGAAGIDGVALLKSAVGLTVLSTNTFINLATPLTFTASQLCSVDGDKAVLEANITNSALLGRGISGEVKVIFDTNPSTSPQNITRVPVTLFDVSILAVSNGTLKVDIYRKTQTSAFISASYIDSKGNSISYATGLFTTDFSGPLSLTLQGRLLNPPTANGEAIGCNTLTVTSFKQ